MRPPSVDALKPDRVLNQGKEAWESIKAARVAHRPDWLCLGAALRLGHSMFKERPGYAGWLKETGFADIPQSVREGAEQYAVSWRGGTPGGSLPESVRAWYRDRTRKPCRRPTIVQSGPDGQATKARTRATKTPEPPRDLARLADLLEEIGKAQAHSAALMGEVAKWLRASSPP
jgi:hypothetical protein